MAVGDWPRGHMHSCPSNACTCLASSAYKAGRIAMHSHVDAARIREKTHENMLGVGCHPSGCTLAKPGHPCIWHAHSVHLSDAMEVGCYKQQLAKSRILNSDPNPLKTLTLCHYPMKCQHALELAGASSRADPAHPPIHPIMSSHTPQTGKCPCGG